MNAFKVSLAFSTACAYSSIVFSDPSINEVKGALTIGSEITVTGQNFSSAKAIPLLFDEVSNIPSSSDLKEGEPVPTSKGVWTDNGSPWANEIVKNVINDYSPNGTSTQAYLGLGKSHMGWPEPVTDAKTRVLYVSWLIKPNEDFGKDEGPNKIIRVWDVSDGEHTRISWNAVALGYSADGEWAPTDWNSWGGSPNLWNRLEFYVNADTGVIKAWTNGKIVHNVSDFKKSSSTSNGLNIALIGFDPRTGSTFSNLVYNMTDIYASQTLARVELSDKSNWSEARSRREVQPIVSWSSSQIIFKVSDSRFDLSKPIYIYVVDKQGKVNQTGYALTGCSRCPAATTIEIK